MIEAKSLLLKYIAERFESNYAQKQYFTLFFQMFTNVPVKHTEKSGGDQLIEQLLKEVTIS